MFAAWLMANMVEGPLLAVVSAVFAYQLVMLVVRSVPLACREILKRRFARLRLERTILVERIRRLGVASGCGSGRLFHFLPSNVMWEWELLYLLLIIHQKSRLVKAAFELMV